MRKLIMLVSAAAMAASMPALAKPGQGGGKPAAKAQTSTKAGTRGSGARTRTDVKARTDVRSGGKARTDSRANVRATTRTGASVDRTRDVDRDGIPDHRDRLIDRDGNGIADVRDRLIDRDRDGIDDRRQGRSAALDCPPGLEKKTPACIPPGQAKKMFNQGQRIPTGYDYFSRYEDIPVVYRDRYGIPTGQQYIYRDRRVYVVDPATRLVTRIIDLID
jgi:hypothetical protein